MARFGTSYNLVFITLLHPHPSSLSDDSENGFKMHAEWLLLNIECAIIHAACHMFRTLMCVLHEIQESVMNLMNLTDRLQWYYIPGKLVNILICRQKSAAPPPKKLQFTNGVFFSNKSTIFVI